MAEDKKTNFNQCSMVKINARDEDICIHVIYSKYSHKKAIKSFAIVGIIFFSSSPRISPATKKINVFYKYFGSEIHQGKQVLPSHFLPPQSTMVQNVLISR